MDLKYQRDAGPNSRTLKYKKTGEKLATKGKIKQWNLNI